MGVADAVVAGHRIADGVRAAFAPAELAELTLTVAFANAFSRLAIGWGPPPDMPVIEVPTPSI